MKLSRFFTALGVSLCALSINTASAAFLAGDTLYVDFGPSTKTTNGNADGLIMPNGGTSFNSSAGNSTGVADTYGIYWNNAIYNLQDTAPTPSAVTNLITSTNVGTGVGITFSNGWQANGFQNGGLVAPDSSLLGPIASKNATGDYFFVNGNTATLTLTGLNPALTYNFQIFATRETTEVRTSLYTITDINGLHSLSLQTSGPGIGANGYNGNNNKFANFTGLVPTGAGTITMTVASATNNFAYIGTMQVTAVAVPEPGTVALLGAAGLTGLVVYRRRRA